MPSNKSDKTRIKDIEKITDKEIYGVDTGDIKNDRSSKIADKLKNIKGKNIKANNGDVLDLVTDIIRSNDSGNTSYKSSNRDEDKEVVIDNISKIFSSDSFSNDSDRLSRYFDYEIIDSYIPEVSSSLEVLADSIISPDDISKQSAVYFYKGMESESNDNIQDEFIGNMKELFEKYDLNTFIRNSIKDGLKLGDDFVIVSKLSDEFSKILNEDDSFDYDTELLDEGYKLNEQILFTEKDDKLINDTFEALYEEATSSSKKKKTFVQGQEEYNKNTKKEIVDAINKNVKFAKDPFRIISDSGKNGIDKETRKKLVDVNGVYFKHVSPSDIIKLEIDHICIGYIYIDRSVSEKGSFNNSSNNLSMLGSLASVISPDIGSASSFGSSNGQSNVGISDFGIQRKENQNGNTALEYGALTDILIKGISKKIDKKFIEKNDEFRDIIYTLVRKDYIINKEVAITFLEPNMVEHLKLDSTETYGVSRLYKSLFPAKLYLSSMITNLMVKINQGRDKRVFYVDADMDNDYEGAIEKLIRDIKSKEIPTDMFGNGKSIGSALRTVGSLDNFYIPTINGKFLPNILVIVCCNIFQMLENPKA